MSTVATYPFYVCYLQAQYALRAQKNHRYSLRAFARQMGIDPGTLSRVISGKIVPGPKVSLRILGGLNPLPAERAKFLRSIVDERRKRGDRWIAGLVPSPIVSTDPGLNRFIPLRLDPKKLVLAQRAIEDLCQSLREMTCDEAGIDCELQVTVKPLG